MMTVLLNSRICWVASYPFRRAFAYPLKLNQYLDYCGISTASMPVLATSNSLLFSFTIADINLRDILSSSAANIFSLQTLEFTTELFFRPIIYQQHFVIHFADMEGKIKC
jgi:hypothetical protein